MNENKILGLVVLVMVSISPYYMAHAQILNHVVCHLIKAGTVTPKQFNWNRLLIEKLPCSVFGRKDFIWYFYG